MSGVSGILVTAVTHQGHVRERNEDGIAVGEWIRSAPMVEPMQFRRDLDAPLLCAVADGMGGHPAGDEASRRVLFHLVRDMPDALDEAALADRIRDAHRELFAAMAEDASLRGMGSTLVGLFVDRRKSLHFNVGDSRLYRVRDGFIRQISTDDVPAGDAADAGPRRSGQLTQCLGGILNETSITPHVGSEPLVPGWVYLLCSDGLTDLVNLDRIEAVLTDDSSDDVKANVLLTEALGGGGTDNVSLIIVRLMAANEVRS